MALQRIINFHGIGTPKRELEPGEAPYWISEDFYREILDDISVRLAVSPGTVAITFDDGNSSDLEIGVRWLSEHNLTASFFVLAKRLGDEGSLGAGDLPTLSAEGHRIGTHGYAHRDWRVLTKEQKSEEYYTARSTIENATGATINAVAIPFGAYNRTVLSDLMAANYKTIYTSDGGPAEQSAWLKARWSVRANDTLETVRNALDGDEPAARSLRRSLSKIKKRLL